MDSETIGRGSRNSRHSGSVDSPVMSRDSALSRETLNSIDSDDENADATNAASPSRSKSTDGRISRINATSQPIASTATSADRFKHGIRYITDGFLRKVTKQNNVGRIRSLNLSNLRDKKIRYIENLQTLINLQDLDLSNNLIEKIDGLKTLKKLKYLSLANNFIQTIVNLEDLSHLETLDLHQNQIQTVPIWFGRKLTSLKTLNLANNHISSFDQIARLRTLYELRELQLQGNTLDQNEHYRLLVISYVPSLQRLDGLQITEDERKQAKEQFIQQEVQNLLHELERRDNECRRLSTQATNSEQQLGKTSDKLQSVETKSILQAKEIQDLQERLAASDELLQRKTTLLHQSCEKQYKLEQELAFYKIDLKFDRLTLSQHFNRRNSLDQGVGSDSPLALNHFLEDEEEAKSSLHQRSASAVTRQTNAVQRIIGDASDGKFLHSEDEAIYNEKLLKLALGVSELTAMQAKQQLIEQRLRTATQQSESHAVIEHLSDDLNSLQTEMMDKISGVHELKLVLSGLRSDQGKGIDTDLEQVTIELKLDEVVRQHFGRRQNDSGRKLYEDDRSNEETFEQPSAKVTPSSGETSARIELLETALVANVEQLRAKEISEQEALDKVAELSSALQQEQNQAHERINHIEEMAEREKQRILKHLEDEKRFTRDIISKSETMIEQLKRELSSERKRKTDEEKSRDALRDIYKKMMPQQGKFAAKFNKDDTYTKETIDDNDDVDEESRLDGETTVYHKDDPFFASTPRDQSILLDGNESADSNAPRRQLEEQLRGVDDESVLVDQRDQSINAAGTSRAGLPPMSKRRANRNSLSSASSSFDKTRPSSRKLDSTSNAEDDDENDLLFRLHGYMKAGQANVSGLGDLARITVNDSGYSSQQTGRDTQKTNAKLESLLSTQPFSSYNKCFIDPEQFNREYTVGVVTANTDQQQRFYDSSKVGNVTLYPTPDGYVLGPHSVTVPADTLPFYTNGSPSRSLTHTDSQFFACVNIPPDALSSNRPSTSSRDRRDELRLQGPVILRQDTVCKSEDVSPVSVKLRSLKFPEVEESPTTDSNAIRRDIDRTSDELDYLKLRLQRRADELPHDHQLHALRDSLERQTREIERIKTIHRDMINSGRDNEATLLDLSQQIQRIQRNVHEHLSPSLVRFTEGTPRINPGQFIPVSGDMHWICTVPRHADLEQIIADLETRLDQQRRELADLRHENRRLVKRSMKMDGLDLAASHKRSRSIADLTDKENIQDDIYVLEQQLLRRQREIAVANEQLREMTFLSQNVVHDLKTARQRQAIAKRETKNLEQKIDLFTRRLYTLTNDTQQAEDAFDKASSNLQLMAKEQGKLDKSIDEKRALSIVLDEQLHASFHSFNSLLHASMKCLHELTSATTEDELRFNSLPPPSLQTASQSSHIPPEEMQRQISHMISENSRVLSRYHAMLQQQKQKSTALKSEVTEAESMLADVKSELDAYNEQLRKNAQELLQDKNVLQEVERVKELKSDKLSELERLIERRRAQEKHAQTELEQLANEQQRLKKQYKDALAEHDQLQHNIEADRQILSEMKKESGQLREQIKTFLDEKEQLDEACDLLAKKCEALHNACKEKEQSSLPGLISQIDEKLTVCKSLEDEVIKLKSEKTRCLEEVTEMKEKIEKKRIELGHSTTDAILDRQGQELRQRIRRSEQDLDRITSAIDERNRTLNELNTMIAYTKNIMKNAPPTENHRNFQSTLPSDFPILDHRYQQENATYYETKIQRLTAALNEKEQELRSMNMQLIMAKDELLQMQYKVQNQESNAETVRNSMQVELDKLRHWLQIYENRKALLRPQYHETLKELELKLHEQEMFFRKQIKDLDAEMKRKSYGRPSDDSGFFSDTPTGDHRISPTIDASDTSMLREQIQNIFSQHTQELDKCNSKYKTNLSNLKNRLHELENSTTSTTTY